MRPPSFRKQVGDPLRGLHRVTMMDGNALEDKPVETRFVRIVRRTQGNRLEEAGILPRNAWMITFADLCTLILTFFVLLFSMSSLNEAAFRSTFQAPRGAGIVGDFRGNEPGSDASEIAIRQLADDLEDLAAAGVPDLTLISGDGVPNPEAMGLLCSGNAVWLRRLPGKGNFALLFGEKLFFESGEASLDARAYPILEVLAGFLAAGSYRCSIDGHTDAVPIHNRSFANNEELSLARSLAVLYVLTDRFKVDPKLLASGAYGSSYPIAEENTPEARAVNRRVEMIFHKVK